MTLNGYNLAKWYIDDYVEDSLKDRATVYGNKDRAGHMLWLGVPRKLFEEYAVPSPAKDEAMELLKEGKYGTTVFYDKDRNFKRWLLMKHMYHNYFKDYQTYFKVNKEQYFSQNK